MQHSHSRQREGQLVDAISCLGPSSSWAETSRIFRQRLVVAAHSLWLAAIAKATVMASHLQQDNNILSLQLQQVYTSISLLMASCASKITLRARRRVLHLFELHQWSISCCGLRYSCCHLLSISQSVTYVSCWTSLWCICWLSNAHIVACTPL